ncbi:hypothetical protein MJO28_017613 [Puccinia striiformis f. sp. tritici]|nr:hypothetical protein MJO28_017613 [Puccinia striiformis f. sp. tritici]
MTGNYYKKKNHWKIIIKEPHHNHPPSEDSSAHAIHRRLNEKQKALVVQLTHAGVWPLQIKSALMQETETPSLFIHSKHNLQLPKPDENRPSPRPIPNRSPRLRNL